MAAYGGGSGAYYCVSKSAMDQMTSCTALELASKGVRVNGVIPGVIVTQIYRAAGMTEDQYAKYIERQKKDIQPMRRVGEAEEVVQAIAFLASSSASFITGQHLHVDGGWQAACPQ